MKFFARLGAVSLLFVVALPPAAAVAQANGSVTYAYDALGRIVSASYDTGVVILYAYDANGNRTEQVINANSATLTWTATVTPCASNCWGAGLW